MSRAASGRAAARLALAAGALVLGPALLAGPAHADSPTPTPIASEPAGGATCLPGTSATCGQDVAPSPTPTTPTTSTPAPATTTPAAPAPTAESQVSSLPVSGRSSPHLARTGAGSTGGWGYAGTGLLLGGGALVLAARRPRRASR